MPANWAQRASPLSSHRAVLAYLLAYDDTNSFYRAFRQWTGATPEKARIDGRPIATT